MSTKRLLLSVIVPVALSPAWSYSQHAGVAFQLTEGTCFVTKASALAAQTTIAVVDPGTGRQYRATIVRAADKACVDDTNQSPGLRGYAIAFQGSQPDGPFYGIGIAGMTGSFRISDHNAVADLDGDRHDEFLRFCLSSEGVHFTIWSGAPLTGKRRWHQYQYLGYDVTPSCTRAETALP